jgi:hypothetical protein
MPGRRDPRLGDPLAGRGPAQPGYAPPPSPFNPMDKQRAMQQPGQPGQNWQQRLAGMQGGGMPSGQLDPIQGQAPGGSMMQNLMGGSAMFGGEGQGMAELNSALMRGPGR